MPTCRVYRIQRNGGATAAELQQATGWQPRSVRGLSRVAPHPLRIFSILQRWGSLEIYDT
jgi:hypothetical protein